MNRKYWRISSFDKKRVAELAYEYGYDELAVFLLAARGITEPEDIDEFLNNDTELSDPFLLKDMNKAVARIRRAIDGFERIAVYGDYDADGVTATALLYLYLESQGADVTYYIPSRMEEGYGLHNEAVDTLAERGVKLIITVDNGINSTEEAEYIRSKGIDLVITDHHQPGGVLPDAAAVVNPHRADDISPFKDTAGVGVAFKLVAALEDGDYDSVLADFADIVTIGTIADIVPLRGENRLLAVKGIEAINNTSRCGIVALRNKTCGNKELNAQSVAFTIAPRINAAGRIEEATTALRLLLTEDDEEAAELADKLDSFNIKRQETEAEIIEEAVRLIENNEKLKYSKVLVVDGEGWHSGVIGIVASKLVDKYGKPAMVIARDGSGEAKGSCRSIDGFSLFDALTNASDLLVRFGGHTLAAGFTVRDDKIDEFRQRINEYADSLDVFCPVMMLDCKINPAKIDMGFVDSLSLLEPFGAENPQPMFGIYNVVIKNIKAIGTKLNHTRIVFEKKGQQYAGVYFGITPEELGFDTGDKVDIAVYIDKNEYKGEVRPGIYIKGLRSSEATDDDYFASEMLYNKIRSGKALSENERFSACPDRYFSALVFRFVKSAKICNCSPEQIAIKLGYGSEMTCRVRVVLDAFCELGLIEYDGTGYRAVPDAPKVSLGNAKILKQLGYKD